MTTDVGLYVSIGFGALVVLWGLSLWLVRGHYKGEMEFLTGQLSKAMVREGKLTDRIRDLGQKVFEKETEIRRLGYRITDLENARRLGQ